MHYDTSDLVPLDHIKIANEMAARYALDAPIRRAAARILEGCTNIPVSGPRQIALWIRKNLTYQQEAPGVEIVQGPYHTLRYGVGDCDDLALTMATLCRAAGIRAYLCGVGKAPTASRFLHAICWVPGVGHFELSDDRNYGGIGHRSEKFEHKPSIITVYYDPEPRNRGYHLSTGTTYVAVDRSALEERAVIMGHMRGVTMGVAPWQMGGCSSCTPMGKTTTKTATESAASRGGSSNAFSDFIGYVRDVAGVAPDVADAYRGITDGDGSRDSDISAINTDAGAATGVPGWVWFVGAAALGGVVLMVAKS